MSTALILILSGVNAVFGLATVGNTVVFPEITNHATRRAESFIMPADGVIQSITIYHQGGTGDMLLGVYLGDVSPDTRLAATVPTQVSPAEGWQTVPLADPVWVARGTPIWLAWVFENNPGIRYQVDSAGWVESQANWAAGMPDWFGPSAQSSFVYSVYADYIGDTGPVINEVLFRNDTRSGAEFLDEDHTRQGWIELYNPGDTEIDLRGYYLSDSRAMPQKWAFPEITLGPKQFLLVWGSGKDRQGPELHTSFNVMNSRIILLSRGAGTEVDVLEDIEIPVDHSYGRYPDGADRRYFYVQPTPGLANPAANRKEFAITRRHVSLTVGNAYQLHVEPEGETVTWSSDNPLVSVDPTGKLLAVEDALGENSQAVITARSVDGVSADTCHVTIVNWTANLSELQVVATPPAHYILGAVGESLCYMEGSELYVTADGMKTSQLLGTLPEIPDDPILLTTPFGHFIRTGRTIYRSEDLAHWTRAFAMNSGGLSHSFAYDWEEDAQTGYLYTGEYSVESNDRHAVYRGVFPVMEEPSWETVLDFAPLAQWESDPSILDAARHVHVVAVDPYTGYVWVGTGDADAHSRILYSDDHGESFRLLGMGNQPWRTLSMWFTEHYVYWNVDSSRSQSIWRIPRSKFQERGFWPEMTPELAWGTTEVGVRYYVTANATPDHFPTTTGQLYVETVERPLDGKNRVRALNDPQYDYRQEVVQLHNGSLWYHLWVNGDDGHPILIMGAAAEGAQRDYMGRVFGIKEQPDGSADVQELLAVNSIYPYVYNNSTRYVQLVPKAQDASGYIYFLGLRTNHRIYKTRLIWTDNPSPQ